MVACGAINVMAAAVADTLEVILEASRPLNRLFPCRSNARAFILS